MLLVFNADDLGMSPAITEGILRAHERGVVRSASAFVTTAAARAALRDVRRAAPALGIGLHVDWSYGAPVSDRFPRSLLAAGDAPRFVTAPEVLAALCTTNGAPTNPRAPARAEALERAFAREIDAQIDAFTGAAGAPPDHLDAHQHLAYLHPIALRAFTAVAIARGLPVRSARAFTGRALGASLDRITRDNPDARSLRHLVGGGAAQAEVLDRAPTLLQPAALVTAFHGADSTLEKLRAIVEAAADAPAIATEIMCHPAARSTCDADAYRVAQLALLASPELSALLDRAGAELGSFGDLVRRSARGSGCSKGAWALPRRPDGPHPGAS